MSIDNLQNKIRKLKNPSMVTFVLGKTQIPSVILEEEPIMLNAYRTYAKGLLNALRDVVPAVRFGFGTFAIFGAAGIELLQELLAFARQVGYYILLDLPEITSSQEAEFVADVVLAEDTWTFDGLTVSAYIGSDALKPFLTGVESKKKDIFVLLRTANKSAQEIQDLLTGSRLVHTAAADMVKRVGQHLVGRSGFSSVAGVGAATSPDSLQTLRNKYPEMFLVVDGYDYSGANAKNCSCAFDKLGHGAIVCASDSVICAWQDDSTEDCFTAATTAAERMRMNLTRYVTIL